MISVKNLSFSYSKGKSANPVFADFNLEIQPGVTLLKGFSGCGKTTLLRLLAGFLEPDSGAIVYPEGVVCGTKDFRRRQMAFVFQSLNMLPLASVRRNCELAASITGEVPDFEARLLHWSKRLGVDHLLDVRPSQLSGGQNQRASLARALIPAPQFLFMDEPSSGLDDLNTSILVNSLKEYLSEGQKPTYLIISTHDSRMETFANEIHDFNYLLSTEGHLQSLAGTAV